ncbi:hypothetical protein PVBG_05482 [Plasmodium vivax Brazil I]|uniref:Uncharacterized protein n=1 Tax=Plasmodium vivax (strain Brazil I) TaxID=1033975 RepID=A0A0J9VHC9_PLAV1|nr:hypothetical protein PVBG_05482 [Plasmodium vivax Brazil I]
MINHFKYYYNFLKYLNYECYDFLKRKFHDKSLSETREGYLRKAVDILKQNNNILGSYEEILQEISSYVTNSGAFFYADPRLPCKYINYWLYDTIKDKNPFSSDELLNAFYNKITKISDCQTYKKHIEKEVYNELKELYNLHEHLFKYKNESTGRQEKKCDHAKNGAELYESCVVKCKWGYNPDYCTSLEKFRKVYEKRMTQDQKCLDIMQTLTPVGHNPVANFLNVTLAMSIITFVFIYFYKVCNNTILNIF